MLVTPDDLSKDLVPTGEELAVSPQDTSQSVERARRLEVTGGTEAAFFKMWVVFERILRAQAIRIGIPIERLAPLFLGHLYSDGELSIPEYDTAKQLLKIRNQVVHGIRVADLQDQYARLGELVRKLQAE